MMDDVLQRMLEVDRQGEQLVKDAEAKASALREENAKELTRRNTEFAAETVRMCNEEIAAAVKTAEAERERQLILAKEKLGEKRAQFAASIADRQAQLVNMLTGLEACAQ